MKTNPSNNTSGDGFEMKKMLVRAMKKPAFVILLILLLHLFISGETIRVPRDFSTIKQAVIMASDGDIIEVEDGFYLEKNIVIDKKVHLKSRKPFGAVIDGGNDSQSAVFIVRSEAEIEGFVLKNSGYGIIQRDSPDVEWTAHDLVFLNTRFFPIYINDRENNIGSAFVYNLLIDNCTTALTTNDAGRLRAESCLVTNAQSVFAGYNHLDFSASDIKILNCGDLTAPPSRPKEPFPPAHHDIQLGPDIVILDNIIEAEQEPPLKNIIHGMLSEKKETPPDEKSSGILEGISLNLLGDVYMRLEEFEKAAQFFAAAAAVGERTGSLETIWDSCFGLARIMEKQGKNHDAVIYYKKSIEAIENVRSKLHLMEHKSAYMQSKMKVYESIVNLLFEMHRKSPHEKFHEEAFLFVERSKARAFFDKLEESDMDLAAGLDPETRAELDVLLNEIADIQYSLKQPAISLEDRNSLIASLEKKEACLTDAMIRLKTKNRNFADLLSPLSPGYEEVRTSLLDDRTALLEYYIGKNHSFAFLATNKDLHIARLPDARKIDHLVDKYLDFLLLKDTDDFRGTKGGARLCEILVGPFEDYLASPIEKLIVVPDAGLLYLPFEALVRKAHHGARGQKHPRFLIRDFEISYAPSSSALLNITARNAHESGPMDLLALASDESVFGLPPLDHAVREVKSIAKLFDKDKKVLLVNDMATEHELKKMELKRFKIIHFATHAIVDTDKWYRSAIVLNHSENTREDGLLQPQDFFQNDVASDLVVLSACQTRRGRLEAGEGMFGLTRAFLYSGSRSVLSSLWKIDDKSSSRFMEYFYQYLTEGKTKDAALRLSKIKMMDSKYRHPRYWAAFVLTGDISPLSQDD